MRFLEYKMPPAVSALKTCTFFIYDEEDKRVLGVLSYEKNDKGEVYGYNGKAFRKAKGQWLVLEKFISSWDLLTFPKRYDYTKEWKRAVDMALEEEE